jgi:4-amino-4-deoxy-L-arabinose transferase-like glycosyltransferase
MNILSLDKKIPLVFIIVYACLSWGGQYALRTLWEPDEARYTYVAKEMSQTGNWLVPQRNGTYYTHKPPLMFWLIKASTLLTNGAFNGISGRLPTLLGAILALWALVRLAALWYGQPIAWHAFFILSSSFLFWHKAGTGQIDMLLLGLELAALYLLFKNSDAASAKERIVAFVLMGLAILAKGPVGLIIPVGIFVTANILAGRKKRLLKTYWLWGIPLALSLPVIWMILVKLNHAPPGYFHELLFDQNVGRLQGTYGGHNKPFYYYLKYLVIDFLPWTLLMPAVLWILIKKKLWEKETLALAGWIFFVVIFFSFCGGKRNLYILSVYPAASLLVASAVCPMNSMPDGLRNFTVYLVLVVLFLLSQGAFWVPLFISMPVSNLFFIPLGVIFLAGTVLLFRHQRKQGFTPGWIHRFIIIMIIAEFYIGTGIFPAFNTLKSPFALAEAAQTRLAENQNLIYYQMDGEIFSLYSNRGGSRVDNMKQLLSAMEEKGHGIAVFQNNVWEQQKPTLCQWGDTHYFEMGDKKLIWLEYDRMLYEKNKNTPCGS